MVTSRDLATALGLSTTAISQILNGKGRFPAATRERVLARARELGYRRNAHARATRMQRFNTLAMLTVTPTWKGGLYPGLLAGALAETTTRGVNLLVAECSDASLVDLQRGPGLLREQMCDGILVNYHIPPPREVREAVLGCGVPVAWLNLKMDSACVYPDELSAAACIARTLIAQGHRRPAFLDFRADAQPASHFSADERRDGFLAGCTAAGLHGRASLPATANPDARRQAVRALLAAPDRPDAILTYGPREALVVMLEAAALGLRLPDDLSLVMFHDGNQVEELPIDAVLLPLAEVSATAVRLVIDAAAGGSIIPATPVPFGQALGRTSAPRR